MRALRTATAVALLILVFCLFSCEEAAPTGMLLSVGVGRETQITVDVPKDFEPSSYTVFVDPGHGMEDVGTHSAYLGELTEKDITLALALKLKAELEEVGFTVVLSHEGNGIPSNASHDGNNLFNPGERIAYLAKYDADLFVSIHCDSYEADSSVSGTRVYYCSENHFSPESEKLTHYIKNSFNGAFPEAKAATVKAMDAESAYYVIRYAKVPSTLIELGFVTNQTDAANMLSDAWQETAAVAIAAGITMYFAD